MDKTILQTRARKLRHITNQHSTPVHFDPLWSASVGPHRFRCTASRSLVCKSSDLSRVHVTGKYSKLLEKKLESKLCLKFKATVSRNFVGMWDTMKHWYVGDGVYVCVCHFRSGVALNAWQTQVQNPNLKPEPVAWYRMIWFPIFLLPEPDLCLTSGPLHMNP